MAHPKNDPLYDKVDYIRNSIYTSAQVQLGMLLEEGASLKTVAVVAQQLQHCIHRAYLVATQTAAQNISGEPEPPPTWNTGFGEDEEDDNPFSQN